MKEFFLKDKGIAVTEYAVLVAVIAAVFLVGMQLFYGCLDVRLISNANKIGAGT